MPKVYRFNNTSEKPLTRSKSCANTELVRNIAPTAAARKEHGRSASVEENHGTVIHLAKMR